MAELDEVKGQISMESDTSGVDEASKSLDGFGETLNSIGAIIAGIGLEKLAEDVLSFGKAVVESGIEASAELQNMKIAFDTAFGEGSAKALNALNDLSYATPFANEQLDQFALKLKNSGVGLEKISPFLKQAGDVASGTGTNFADMGNILASLTNTYALAATRGSVSSRMLLSTAREGIPIYQALADVLNKSGNGVKYTADMIAKGGKDITISADAFSQAIALLGSSKYLGDAQKQAETYTGSLKNMEAKFVDLGHTILGVSDAGEVIKGGLFDKISGAAAGMFSFLQAHEKDILAISSGFIAFGNNIARVVTPAVNMLIKIFQAEFAPVLADLQKLWKEHHDSIILVAKVLGTTLFVALVGLGGVLAIIARLLVGIIDLFAKVGEWIGKTATAVNNFINKFKDVGTSLHNMKIPGFASGVSNFAGGLATVGERGPETLYLPRGSSVKPSVNNSRNVSISMQNNVNTQSDWSSIAKEIGWRVNGR